MEGKLLHYGACALFFFILKDEDDLYMQGLAFRLFFS